MAAFWNSTSVPSSSSSFGGVFLSFREADNCKGFASRLYKALKDAGIRTFMDNEGIKAGENIDERLLKAIKESVRCVVIISSGYADSKSCLMELTTMFVHGKTVIPVFYYVDPSDVKRQTGPFTLAFTEHRKRLGDKTVQRWEQPMTRVGHLQGFTLSDGSGTKESEVIQGIVKRVGGATARNPPAIAGPTQFRGLRHNSSHGDGGPRTAALNYNMYMASRAHYPPAVHGDRSGTKESEVIQGIVKRVGGATARNPPAIARPTQFRGLRDNSSHGDGGPRTAALNYNMYTASRAQYPPAVHGAKNIMPRRENNVTEGDGDRKGGTRWKF